MPGPVVCLLAVGKFLWVACSSGSKYGVIRMIEHQVHFLSYFTQIFKSGNASACDVPVKSSINNMIVNEGTVWVAGADNIIRLYEAVLTLSTHLC